MQLRSNTKQASMFDVQGWAHLPSFDHGVGDPVEKDIYVSPTYDPYPLFSQSTKLVCNSLSSLLLPIRIEALRDSCGVTRHRVVVVEGNYLLMEEGEWTGLGDLFDERWYGSNADILKSV